MFSSFSVKLKGETYADPRLALKGREFALVGRLFDSSLWSKISWIPGVKNTDPLLEPLRLSFSSPLLAMISPTAPMVIKALIEQNMIILTNWRNFRARIFENGNLLWIPSWSIKRTSSRAIRTLIVFASPSNYFRNSIRDHRSTKNILTNWRNFQARTMWTYFELLLDTLEVGLEPMNDPLRDLGFSLINSSSSTSPSAIEALLLMISMISWLEMKALKNIGSNFW